MFDKRDTFLSANDNFLSLVLLQKRWFWDVRAFWWLHMCVFVLVRDSVGPREGINKRTAPCTMHTGHHKRIAADGRRGQVKTNFETKFSPSDNLNRFQLISVELRFHHRLKQQRLNYLFLDSIISKEVPSFSFIFGFWLLSAMLFRFSPIVGYLLAYCRDQFSDAGSDGFDSILSLSFFVFLFCNVMNRSSPHGHITVRENKFFF